MSLVSSRIFLWNSSAFWRDALIFPSSCLDCSASAKTSAHSSYARFNFLISSMSLRSCS